MKQEFVTLPREVVDQIISAFDADMVTSSGWKKNTAAALRAALEQLQDHAHDVGNMVQAGWKLVPMEPTIRQMAAMGPAIRACYDMDGVSGNVVDVYRAMLAAAPQPPYGYDQQALDLCQTCGWKTLIPGDCCLNCARQKPQAEQEPAGDDRQLHIGACITEGRLYASVMRTDPNGSVTVIAMSNMDAASLANNDCTARMLPAQQPKREPLTDEQIIDIADDYKTQWVHGGQTYDQFDSMAFARAIEAAHNIK